MPIAVTGGSERFDLKSLPGAFVVIKRMNHGEKIQRGSFADKMRFVANKKSKDMQGEIDLMQAVTTRWEWQNLILEHNLEEYIVPNDPSAGTRTLNLKLPEDINKVDAKVAEEISSLIDKVNNFEDDFEDGDSLLGKSA